VTQEEKEKIHKILLKAKKDRVWAIEKFIQIKNKKGEKVPLKLWPFQKQLVELLHDPTVRHIIVYKYRQGGISVCILADTTIDARFSRNVDYRILNKDDEDTATMFDHVHFMRDNLPKELQSELTKRQDKALQFADNNCMIKTTTAGQTEDGSKRKARSTSLRRVHVTEGDYIKFLATLHQAADGSVAHSPKNKIIWESTSDGPSGAMQAKTRDVLNQGTEEVKGERWRLAGDSEGSDIVVVFFGAHKHPEYRLVPKHEVELTNDEEEQRVYKVCIRDGLSETEAMGFVLFRRAKLSSYTQDSEQGKSESPLTPQQRFKREFPISIEDCWETGDRTYFDPALIRAEIAYLDALQPKWVRKSIHRSPGERPWLAEPTADNCVNICRAPVDGWQGRYCAFADWSEGLATGDYMDFRVLDRVEREEVAYIHGHFTPLQFIQMILATCELYYRAWLDWDITGNGTEARPFFVDSMYPRLLWKKKIDPNTPTKKEPRPFDEPQFFGLRWNQANKYESCGLFRAGMTRKTVKVYDKKVLEEALHFEVIDGKLEAATGYHDDRIKAWAGLMHTDRIAPPPVKEKATPAFVSRDESEAKIARMKREALNRPKQQFQTWGATTYAGV
jgi:hypothetical protein